VDKYIAGIPFTNGKRRQVFEGSDDRQYVIDCDGDKVYGVWFFSRGEPTPIFIVNAAAQR
jgi:PBCV-specific basic adaptor domain